VEGLEGLMAGSTHRWIVVADSAFLPARDGGQREQFGLVETAARAGYVAALVVPTKDELDRREYRNAFGDLLLLPVRRRLSPLMLLHPSHPYVVASRPAPPGLSRRLVALVPDATGVLTLSYKSHGIGERLAADRRLPLVVRQHNRESDYHRSLADGLRGPRRWVMRWETARIARDEAAFDRSPVVTAFADIAADDAQRRRAAGARRVLHVPPFAFRRPAGPTEQVSLLARRAERAGPPRVVFLGALDVVTNMVGLDWLLDRVWPQVVAVVPGARLDVVGARPSASLRERVRELPGGELHADVPAIEPYLERAWVAVNPAITGSGVNIKLVDYLQAGRPTVSTSLATRGLALRPGVDLEIQDDPSDFARAVVGLLTDSGRAAAIAAAGREAIGALIDPDRNLDAIAGAFERADRARESEFSR
jgi:glycosyltransferase involved in cell wall biosynthesis